MTASQLETITREAFTALREKQQDEVRSLKSLIQTTGDSFRAERILAEVLREFCKRGELEPLVTKINKALGAE